MIKGIDVSSWQDNIDFGKVKASGIDFVIIRAGYGRETSQKDNCFEQNYNAAKAAGLDVGAYWYSYADSAEDAVKEAKACMEVIKGKKFEYPIYFDLEEQSQFAKGRNFCDSVIKAFCGELEKNGYIYTLNKKGVFVAGRSENMDEKTRRDALHMLKALKDEGFSKEELSELLSEVYKEELC